MAKVVPTGAFVFVSEIFISATAANFCPASTQKPKRLNSVGSGPLYGSGIKPERKSPLGASMSLNSPGCNGLSSSEIRMPLALNPAGKLESVPASIS